jgi:hypothetical protein
MAGAVLLDANLLVLLLVGWHGFLVWGEVSGLDDLPWCAMRIRYFG